MKKIFAFYFLLLGLHTYAQKLVITPLDSIIETVSIKPGFTTEVSAYVRNNTSGQVLLKWKFEDYGVTNGYSFSMCDVYNCYSAGPQVREVDLTAGDSTFMKFGIVSNCVGGSGYGNFTLWIDGDSAASSRSLHYNITLLDADCVNSIEDASALNFRLYPNPVSDVLMVDFSTVGNDRSIAIADLSGRVIASEPVSAMNNNISVSNLSSGNYVVLVYEAGLLKARKQFSK